jgi:hypothetical protein
MCQWENNLIPLFPRWILVLVQQSSLQTGVWTKGQSAHPCLGLRTSERFCHSERNQTLTPGSGLAASRTEEMNFWVYFPSVFINMSGVGVKHSQLTGKWWWEFLCPSAWSWGIQPLKVTPQCIICSKCVWVCFLFCLPLPLPASKSGDSGRFPSQKTESPDLWGFCPRGPGCWCPSSTAEDSLKTLTGLAPLSCPHTLSSLATL